MLYIGVKEMQKLVQKVGLAQMITEVAAAIEEDFRRWDEFETIPRLASHTPEGLVELMPTSDGNHYGFKYVNGHPKNYELGLQTVTAFGVYADMKTGYPLMLSEMTIATALRTAAMSALAAKYLARPNSKTMALIGNGCQAEFQAEAFRSVIGVENLRLYDFDLKSSHKLMKNLKNKGLNVTLCESAAKAVEGADILTTVTADKKQATILSDNMVGSGVHINAIGGDCPGKTELAPAILKRGRVFVELEEQSRIEGEIQNMPKDFPVTELWRVFSGQEKGRECDDEITIFDSVGFAIEDFATLRYLHLKAGETGLFRKLDLLAVPDDPRDLYGLAVQKPSFWSNLKSMFQS